MSYILNNKMSSVFFYVFIPRNFSSGDVCCFASRLYMSCAPFLLFRYIWIELV